MSAVIERHGYEIKDGLIYYDDRPSTYEEAERLAGRKLDRRRNYCISDGEVRESCSWTQTCSGCEGGGCRECGYQGKVRSGFWAPLSMKRMAEGEKHE